MLEMRIRSRISNNQKVKSVKFQELPISHVKNSNRKWKMEPGKSRIKSVLYFLHTMHKPVDLHNIRIITVSGRIAAGSTSLAKHIAQTLHWKHLEGGEVFWEAVRRRMDLSPKDTNLRPDEEDVLFDDKLKEILAKDDHIVLETKLAGFFSQGTEGVFRVGVVCDNEAGVDQAEIRIDRLVNREHVSVHDAKAEVLEREKNDLEKWRSLYAEGDPEWIYWDKDYFDLIINTYSHDPDESLAIVLESIGYQKSKDQK
jgi:cytidylate kinase